MKRTSLLLLFFATAILTLIAAPPARIVSLAPSLTQSLYFLEAQEKIVGRTSYCIESESERRDIVASAVTVNVERVVALRPDLVVVAGTLISPENIATLRRFGIQVEIFDIPRSFDEICEQFLRLGALIGKEEKAKRIVDESRRRVSAVSAQMNWQTAPSMFFQIGTNPIFTVVPNTFMNDYITFLGGRNIAQQLRTGAIGREFVVAQNPDYIFIVTMGMVSDEEKNVWRRHSRLRAVRNDRVFIIDAEIACQPTPVTFAETMEVLGKLVLR